MSDTPYKYDLDGPFRAANIRPKDRYELSHGHAIYCAPTGGLGSRGVRLAAQVLGSDPDATEVGVDTGFELDDRTLRAPDIAVGNIGDSAGWVRGRVPPLAVEYASVGQDEASMQEKIAQLLEAGTRWVWVVRCLGPRRVEVYAAGAPTQTRVPGDLLTAPGVLRNSVPVEALFEEEAGGAVTLRNLLQRHGYETLDEVRKEGREEGRAQGGRELLLRQLRAKFGAALTEAQVLQVQSGADSLIDVWADRVLFAGSIDEVLRAAE